MNVFLWLGAVVVIALFMHRQYLGTLVGVALFFLGAILGGIWQAIILIGGVIYLLVWAFRHNPRVRVHRISYRTQRMNRLDVRHIKPCLDVLVHTALRYEAYWDKRKLALIQEMFDEIGKNSRERAEIIRKSLYQKPRPNIENIVARLNKLRLHPDDRLKLYQDAVHLAVETTDGDFDVFRSDMLRLGMDIGITPQICVAVLLEYYQQVHGQSHHTNHQQSQQQHTPKSPINQNELMQSAEILGIDPHASVAEINQAYRQKMRDYHPDRNPQVTDAVRQMLHEKSLAINSAREYMLKRHQRG